MKLYYKLVSWTATILCYQQNLILWQVISPALPVLFFLCLWVSDYDCWEKVCFCKRKFKMDSSCYYILFFISVYLMSINVLAHNTFEFIAKWINRKHIILLDSLPAWLYHWKLFSAREHSDLTWYNSYQYVLLILKWL